MTWNPWTPKPSTSKMFFSIIVEWTWILVTRINPRITTTSRTKRGSNVSLARSEDFPRRVVCSTTLIKTFLPRPFQWWRSLSRSRHWSWWRSLDSSQKSCLRRFLNIKYRLPRCHSFLTLLIRLIVWFQVFLWRIRWLVKASLILWLRKWTFRELMVAKWSLCSLTLTSSLTTLRRRKFMMVTWRTSSSRETRSRMHQKKPKISRRHKISSEHGWILWRKIFLKLLECTRNSKLIKNPIIKSFHKIV